MLLLALAAVCLSAAPSVSALPFFRSRLPNGREVHVDPGLAAPRIGA
jgi:hypothetical protein